jgi:hypothetical protein
MAPQSAPYLHPESLPGVKNAFGGAHIHTLPAFNAALRVNGRSRIIQADRAFPADINTRPAKGAAFPVHIRLPGPDNPHVKYLRPGTGIGAFGNAHPEFMMRFYILPAQISLQKTEHIAFLQKVLHLPYKK